MANHYGRPVIGWADDVARLGRREVINRPDVFTDRHLRFNTGKLSTIVTLHCHLCVLSAMLDIHR